MAEERVAELKVIGSYQGQDWNIVLHFREVLLNQVGIEELINQAETKLTNNLASCMHTDSVIQQYSARFLTPEPEDPEIVAIDPVNGTQAGVGLPSLMAVVLQQRTGKASRRKRGRMYIPGVSADLTADGKLLAAAQANPYQLFGDGYIQNFVTNQGAFLAGIWSRTEYAESNDVDAAFTQLTSCSVNPILGTQRRRRPGSGS